MQIVETTLLTILYIHQTLDMVGVKGYVERPKLKSVDTVVWVIFTILLMLYYLRVSYIPIIFIVVLGLILYGLYYYHLRLLIFGTTEKNIKGYNHFYQNTHHIIPKSETRLIPDTFHFIHIILYFLTFIVLLINQIIILF